MNEFERARAVKRAEEERLLAIPGVHAVGVGTKLVKGERTGDLAIIAFVSEKKQLSDLRQDDVIPEQIDGIRTDVVPSGIPVLQSALTGGSQLWPGGRLPDITQNKNLMSVGSGIGDLGTLGCFAKTSDGHIVAITCHHVVGIAALAVSTPLHSVGVTATGQIVFSGQDQSHTCVVAHIVLSDPGANDRDYDVFYLTTGTGTLAEIASAIAARINALAVPGLQAAPQPAPNAHVVHVTSTSTIKALDCLSQGTHEPDKDSNVKVVVSGNTISLHGRASQNSGAYVDVNVDGLTPTRGVFVPIDANDSAATIANKIVQKINAASFQAITAQKQGDSSVVINNAIQVNCDVTSDVRVGSPKNWFCSECCASCGQRIGIVTETDIALDAALIQLDAGIKYKAQIDDLGIIVGTYDPPGNSEPDTIAVQKHGITTGTTTGWIHAVDVAGNASAKGATDGVDWKIFHRHFTGAISISGNKFGDRGDSGSAVVVTETTVPVKKVRILGILAAVTDTIGFVTPIQPILSRFNLTLETSDQMDLEKEVPHLAAAPGEAAGVQSVAARVVGARLEQIEREVTSTKAGKRYADLVRLHFPEARGLVNANRRIGAVWRRNSGPEIINAFLSVLQNAGQQIPATINEKPLRDCMTEIQSVLVRYGSPELAADLQKFLPPLADFGGLTHRQALDALRGMQIQENTSSAESVGR
jgi:hypothetical protein